MSLEFNFVIDSVTKGKIYPALARHQGRPYTPSWREFGQHYPYTTPLRLQEYCDAHGAVINMFYISDTLPANTFYPVCLGFFDFDIDYFELMSPEVYKRLHRSELRVLFYYHEGDNPQRIKNRLDTLAKNHLLPPDCYVFVSSNTQADQLENFVTFHDFELWYYQRNSNKTAIAAHTESREREFVCLSRLHKWWRATALADLHRSGILDNSYWSYCEAPTDREYTLDNPIELDMISRLRWDLEKFVDGAPYISDELDQDQRNNHSHTVDKYHTNAYCHIVLESQFDVDQSGGAFVTEKTFKPIKHGQLFFVAGGAGSLQVLRDLGYRTFDSVLDNSYDLEPNHTQRWIKLHEAVKKAQVQGLHNLYLQCLEDIKHNQQLFLATKLDRLNTLYRKIHEQS
jgi:hypothetical protein